MLCTWGTSSVERSPTFEGESLLTPGTSFGDEYVCCGCCVVIVVLLGGVVRGLSLIAGFSVSSVGGDFGDRARFFLLRKNYTTS